MEDALLVLMESELARTEANAKYFSTLASSHRSDPNSADWQTAANEFTKLAKAWRDAIELRRKDL